eukprot:GILI01017592.1.p1 GENE.GILI01017592.1~~GILI01017592.1.p1  ORF type:complete len:266 (+),score=8.33 GILI01017592.1:40-798(+)
MVLGWIVAWLLQVIVIIFSFPFTNQEQRLDICGHIFRRISYISTVFLNPMWSITILRKMPVLPKDAKKIVVMNHLSNADPWICSGSLLPSDYAWVCKGSLFKIPFGGWAIANSGDLKIEFTKEKGGWGVKKGSVAKLMEKSKRCLLRGRGLAVYPEGTRNPDPDGPTREFKLGYFTLAIEMGATIVPTAVSGTQRMWPKSEPLFDSSRAFISFGDPISAVGETPESLRDKTYAVIVEMRSQHPDEKAKRKAD